MREEKKVMQEDSGRDYKFFNTSDKWTRGSTHSGVGAVPWTLFKIWYNIIRFLSDINTYKFIDPQLIHQQKRGYK